MIALGCGASQGEERLVREISWSQLRDSGQPVAGEIRPGKPPAPSEYLEITNEQNVPLTVSLVELTQPGITTTQYALNGSVSYEGVGGTGYLEMWNHFPDGSAYFSRTLGQSGPLGSLQGSSNWRPFSLPFFSNAEAGFPSKLQFNLVLPGAGSVRLGPPRLVEYPDGYTPPLTAGAWWDEQTAGWIGGIAGSIIGCIGALIGTLAGLGKARSFVVFLCVASIVFGAACLVAGVVALILSQPYAVYYPLLLLGVICTAVMGGNLPGIRRRYQQRELQKMTAMDVGNM
jgi:hypothetical protein